ncbi:BBE domain-containing protein [Arthrobacter sp. NyZ413]|uniref:BBE domain-containing protein n=1 Tax=Arthrobacter sp. NyZ413 TaxID=3144669 RepID=UPI003BF8C3B2
MRHHCRPGTGLRRQLRRREQQRGGAQSRIQDNYGANYDRLQAIKGKYDPGNLFHVNQNIKPA